MAPLNMRIEAELIGDRIVIWNPNNGSKVYQRGFFGKPIGISKPKSTEFNTPLILGLIEVLYLIEKKVIRIISGERRKRIGVKRLRKHAEKIYDNYQLQYIVYRDLRNKGYIVLPGIKFGSEFAIYERGPGIDHSPYLISVKHSNDNIMPTDIVRAGRLATSVRKKFIIAIPNSSAHTRKKIQYLVFNWFKA
jgi:tRNA-intron endonuclease